MTERYRPQPFWLFKGAALGAGSGAAMGVLTMLRDVWGRAEEPDVAYIPEGVADALVLGIVFGGFAGFLTGILVGAVLALVVGGHLPMHQQRRRALVLGALLPPVALASVALVFLGPVDPGPGALAFLVPGVIGGPLAHWAAGIRLPQPSAS